MLSFSKFVTKKYIPNWLRSIKWLVLNFLSLLKKRVKNNEFITYIVLDLNSNLYERYLYTLCLFLERKEFHILIKFNYGFMNNWGTHQLLQGLENISLYSDKIPKSKIALWLYDKEKPYQVSNSRKVDYDYFSYFQDRYKIPIPFVDTFYVYNYLFQERKNLKDNRNVNVFFAGNFNKEYENTVLNDKFGIPNRVETFLFLKKNFNLEIPETTATELMGKEGAIYIFDRNLRNVPPEELVKFLNNSKFFIAFPGVVMPFCHNVIEAMAMGCIPILNYSKLFTPNLVAYENCLTYSSLQDLKDLILQIPEMDVQMISQMRKNVIAYYDKYLSITAVVDQVLDPIYNRISICAEHQSIELIKS